MCDDMESERRAKRERKPTPRYTMYKDYLTTAGAKCHEGLLLYSPISISLLCVVWCKVKTADDKVHTINARHLESEMEIGEPVTGRDLYVGNTVIWKVKGKPYKVVIIATSRKL